MSLGPVFKFLVACSYLMMMLTILFCALRAGRIRRRDPLHVRPVAGGHADRLADDGMPVAGAKIRLPLRLGFKLWEVGFYIISCFSSISCQVINWLGRILQVDGLFRTV